MATLFAASLIVASLSGGKMPKTEISPRVYAPAETAIGTTSDLPIYDFQLPEFKGITKWWNTPDEQALTPEKLKGKVVLVDFWTYSCINCIRTYPFLRALQEKYVDKGLVIIGVHTPEFAFEADPNNVGREIAKNGLEYAVALDPDYATWNSYDNNSWPAEYFFDRQGRLRRVHLGEGEYDASEEAIRSLLAEKTGVELGPMGTGATTPDWSKIQTPETYFGLERGSAYMGTPGAEGEAVTLQAAKEVSANHWTAGGSWRWQRQYVQADSDGAVLLFNVQAEKLHIVMESVDGKDRTLQIYVDGKMTKIFTVNTSDLYDVAEFPDARRHTVEIRVMDAGVRFYAATFS